jgi:hypothetical protein
LDGARRRGGSGSLSSENVPGSGQAINSGPVQEDQYHRGRRVELRAGRSTARRGRTGVLPRASNEKSVARATQGESANKKKNNFKSEAATAKGKEKRRNRKKERKALEKSKAEKEAGGQEKKEGATDQASKLERQTAPDLVNNPEAKGRGLVDGNREKKEQVMGPQATSGEECSGQKTPDYS